MKNSPILLAKNIKLTPVTNKNVDGFYQYSLNPKLYQYFEFDPFKSKKDCDDYLNKLINRSLRDDTQYWFIRETNQREKVIGSVGLIGWDKYRKSVEIGYGVSPDLWGKGIGSQSLALILKFAIEELNIHRIWATTDEYNDGSIKLLSKNNFKLEGLLRDFYVYKNGKKSNSKLFSLLSSDYNDYRNMK
tara:strand:- start:32 stop:598 length:567 start_codon:yes stop_codon:yes gene_type:complete